MFLKRLLSGIVLVILAACLFIYGGIPLWACCLIISLVGQWELYNAIGITQRTALSRIGYCSAIVYYILVIFDIREYLTAMIVASLLFFMGFFVLTFPKYSMEEITGAFFGMCYVPVLMSYIYMTRMLPDGRYTVWLILLCSWGCDTLSYCTGMLFGKHQMTPILSPQKTWEGTSGGIAGAAILGLIYGLIFKSRMEPEDLPALRCAFACALGAVISIFGDLTASAIKRKHNIKDFGNCIPGHGGILDRFDSVLFTAPVVYYSLAFMSNLI